jgi:hypothetical protein
MLTRQQSKDAFKHILEVILQFQPNDPLYLALDAPGYDDIRQLITMSFEDIDALTYINASQHQVPVASYDRAMLCILKAYHLHRVNQGDPIGDAWTSITAHQFDDYRISPEYNLSSMGLMTPSSSTPCSLSSTTPSQSCVCDVVANFKKGIKRDPTLFPVFKLKKQ